MKMIKTAKRQKLSGSSTEHLPWSVKQEKQTSRRKRLEMWQKEVRPIIEEFYNFIGTLRPSKGSHLGAAVTYVLNQKYKLLLFLGSVDTKPNNASFRQNFTHPALKSLDRRQPACDFLPCLRKIYARKSAYYLSVNTP